MRGFTLLEVLVAMSIFTIIGLGAHQMLTTVLETHERTQAINETFGNLTRAFSVMDRDLSQIANRPVRDEYGEPLPAVMVATGRYPVEVTRAGWTNPASLPRSTLQRVAYELTVDGELERHMWLVLDRAEDTEPVSQTLLHNVRDLRVSVVTEDGERSDVWPDLNAQSALPQAVEVVVDVADVGELRRVFAVVSEPSVSPQGQGQGVGNQGANSPAAGT